MLFWCAENTKTAVLVRGVKCSSLIQRCLKDLAKLKRPNAVTYNQKNDIRPFEVSFLLYSIVLMPEPWFRVQPYRTFVHCRTLCENLIVFSYRKILLIVFDFGGRGGYCDWWTKCGKSPSKKENMQKCIVFKCLMFFFWGLEAFPVAGLPFFMKA